MDRAVIGREIGARLVDELSLGYGVIDIDIRLHLDSTAQIVVRRHLTEGECEKVLEVMEDYELKEKEQPHGTV